MSNTDGLPESIRINGVTFSYKERTILKGIDLTIPIGSYFGIVGPNGSGKTTFAYIVCGIYKPDKGSIETKGLRRGLVLANPANQIVSLVVEEDIAFGPENMGLSSLEINERIEYTLNATHSSHLRKSLTTSLSGGQLAKIAFAGQLALDADILVLDEGTIMLDPLARSALLETVRELNRDLGKTIIHISHRLDDLECADTVAVLDEGLIKTKSSGAMKLVQDYDAGKINSIEPGNLLLYREFLNETGIYDKDIEKATEILAGRIIDKDIQRQGR